MISFRLSMNRPTPDPSQEGSRRSSASCQFPSWEGLGVGSSSQCMRKNERGTSMNPRVLPASCRQTYRRKALPARCRQHLRGANHEVRRNTEIRKTKRPIALLRVVRPSSFGFLSSFVIRHSSFNNLCETGRCSPIFERAFAFFELLRGDKNHGAFFALL